MPSPSIRFRSSSTSTMLLARASSKPRPKLSIQYVPGRSARAVICPASADSWPSAARIRQVSAIFWRRDHGGSGRWRSICSLVRAWYSVLSRMITSLMSRRLLSYRLYAGLACQRGPFRNLGRNISSQLGRAIADHLGALLAQLVADLRQRERRDRGVVQPRQNGRRRAGGREQGIRIVCDQRRETGLGGGRNLGHDGAAPWTRNRKRAQRARAYMRLQRQHGLEGERDLAREQRGHGRGAAAIRYVLQLLQAGQLLE